MKTSCPPEPPAAVSIPKPRPQRSIPPPRTLWLELDPHRQRQLAQCLATLLQRLKPLGESTLKKEDTDHDTFC